MNTIRFLGERHILVGGGGGKASTGVPNGIDIYLIWNAGELNIRKVSLVDRGLEAIMNRDVHIVDAAMVSFRLAFGQEGDPY